MSKSVYSKETEAKFVKSRINFLKREILKLEKEIKLLDSVTVEYNEGKTIGQNPIIKTYNDHIKNINSLYNTLLKLLDEEGGKEDELANFIQARNKRR